MNMQVPPPPSRLFQNLSREHGFEAVPVQGQLPDRLRGTLYRNGAGLFEQFGHRYAHVFEADGAVSALRIADGQAHAAVRVVQSQGLLDERERGQRLSGSAASWPQRVRSLHRGRNKNTANTHVVPWQGELYALMEGGRPTRIDPDTLETLGESDLAGTVEGAFSAHPHRVEARKTTYNFGLVFGAKPRLDLFALPDEGPARVLGSVELDHAVMLHDFIATPRHLVFFVAPIRIVVWRMLLGLGNITDNLRWQPEAGTEVIVVPIDDPDNPIRFQVEAFACFHFAGAFDTSDGITVDYIRYPDSGMLDALGDGTRLTWDDRSTHAHGSLHRARIDVRAKAFQSEALWDGQCEYPRLAPHEEGAQHGRVWMQSSRYVDNVLRFAVSRVDMDNGHAQLSHALLDPGQLSSETVFAQDPGGAPGAGWLLTLVYDSFDQRSHVLIHDAQTLERQARVQLKQAIPLTFHGSWVPA